MKAIETFQLADFVDTLASLTAAFVLGTAIGAERQYRQRTAGLRTNVLVSIGAAAFVDLAMRIDGAEGAVRVISYVVSGIGFLGAGVIMREGANVRGLNTAATLWCSAAVGSCAGADMAAQAFLLTLFVVAGNTVLRRLVHFINRIPLNTRVMEATYDLRITVDPGSVEQVRQAMFDQLKRVHCQPNAVTFSKSGDDGIGLVATFMNISINPDELEAVIGRMSEIPGVRHAAWEMH